ncbi:MAG: hypothetical protein JW844_03280 [Candidatus Omnitrophica bacterium]|nr:hypothetical protein [Candidatus Omnitrophota bacterium]
MGLSVRQRFIIGVALDIFFGIIALGVGLLICLVSWDAWREGPTGFDIIVWVIWSLFGLFLVIGGLCGLIVGLWRRFLVDMAKEQHTIMENRGDGDRLVLKDHNRQP